MSDHERPAGAPGAENSAERADQHPGAEQAIEPAPAPDGGAPKAPERKAAERWAAARGHVDPPAGEILDIAAHKGWIFAATKALHGWPVGKELTGDEYDAAVSKALQLPIR